MSPPEHILIGAGWAASLYSVLKLLKPARRISYLLLSLVALFCAVAPDFDSFFGHYTSKNALYGHRGMTHSVLAVSLLALLIALLYGGLITLLRLMHGQRNTRENGIFQNLGTFKSNMAVIGLCALGGGLSHLLADLLQPGGVWGGIPLLFPLERRFGGWELMGWYDLAIVWHLFLAALWGVLLISAFQALQRTKPVLARGILVFVLIGNCCATLWLSRYLAQKPYLNREQWLQYQKQVVADLPPPVGYVMSHGGKQLALMIRKLW